MSAISRCARAGGPRAALLGCAAALVLSACGGGGGSGAGGGSTGVPGYAKAPFTPQQRLVAQGARLFVADGCTGCHAIGAGHAGLGPSFATFAGSHVTLTDGRRVLVDEALLRRALLEPARVVLRGYPPAPMAAAVARLHLAAQRADVAALAAFIEQIGPES